MTEGHDEMSDHDLVNALRRALDAVDPVPDHSLRAARSAFGWSSVDAELAELVFDSAEESLGVRSVSVHRQVTFRSSTIEVEVMIADGEARRLVGQLIPPDVVDVELVGGPRPAAATTDQLGRFTFSDPPSGPTRLVIRDRSGVALAQTSWLVL
jgi:hypothetical protein